MNQTLLSKYRPLIGRSILLDTGGLQIAMRVLDVQVIYGNVDLLVAPVNGYGKRWIGVRRELEK